MSYRSYSEIYDSIENQIVSRRPGLSVRPTDFHAEAIITPVSVELELLYQELLATRASKSVNTSRGADLLDLGANFSLTLSPATSASGIVSVGTDVLPLKDLLIPKGTLFYGLAGSDSVVYYSLSDIVLPSQSEYSSFPELSPYSLLEGNRLYFLVDVPIRATTTGKFTNSDKGSIRTSSSIGSSFNFIYNYNSIGGGADKMTEEELAQLIPLATTGGIVGSENSYLLSALLQPEVVDAKVNGFSDVGMIRDSGNGGKIDIIVIGENLVQVEETFEDINSLSDIQLSFNPVILISDVVGESLGRISPFVYSLKQEEPGDPRYNSTLSKSYLEWKINTPIDDTITVKYVYNKTVTDILSRIKTRGVSPGTDLLVKTADLVFVDVTVVVAVDSSADRGSLKRSIEVAIRNKLNSSPLGTSIDEGALDALIRSQSDSITRVVTPFRILGISGTGDSNTIVIPSSQYLRAGRIQVLLQ